jgi:TolA-binding protein
MNAERDGVEELLARAARGFERDSAVLSGDDERIERIEREVRKRYAARPPSRARQVTLAVAAGFLLAGAALGALRAAGVLDVSVQGSQPDSAKPAVVSTLHGAGAALPAASTSAASAVPSAGAATEGKPAALVASGSAAPEASPKLAASRPSTRAEAAPAPPESAPAPEAAAKRFDDTPSDASATAAGLFAAANRARVAGNATLAILLSQELLGKFPRSAEAVSTHLSLGMLQLQQGRAALALGEFQAYEKQASGGTLAEALWGKAQALQRLGRTAEERATLTELVSKYPHAAYTAAAQKRLAALP